MQHMQKENRRKPSVFAGFVAEAEGLVLPAGSGAAPRWGAPSTDQGGSRDRFAAERHWRSLTLRHTVLQWMWEHYTGTGEGPVLPDFLDKSETGWCCFGAVGKIGTVMDGKFPILGTIALFGKI